MSIPLVRKTPLLAGAATTLACIRALAADSALEAYEIDQWFSYNFHGLRIRPQLDTSATFSDNVFSAPDKPLEYVDPRFASFALTPADVNNPPGGGYTFDPGNGINQPYTGLVQQRAIIGGANFGVTSLYPASVDPFPLATLPPGTSYFLGGFQTNVVAFPPRTADVIGSVSPGIKLQYGEDDGNVVSIEYNNDNTRYFDLGIVPPPMHRMRARVRYEKSRLKFEANQSAFYLASFLGGGANQGQRLVERWTAATDAKLTYDSTAKTDVYASAQYNFTDYQTAINLYSVNAWRGNLGATYKPTERLFVFTEGHYGQTALRPSVSTLQGAPYSQIYGGFVGIRGKFTPKIEGSIRGGYEIREFPSVGNASYGIPAADVSLSYTPRDSTMLTLSYVRRTDVSAQVARQAVAYDQVKFSVRQVIGARALWMATSDIGYSMGSFDDLRTLNSVVYDYIPGSNVRIRNVREANFKRTETVMNFNAGITYSPRRWLRTGLSYEYENYGNSFADAGFRDFFLPSYDAHRVMLGVQIGY
jgi:hypothetical protein